jgi:hypothetical protein
MVRRMTVRAAWLAPVVIGVLWIVGGSRYGLSAAVGIAMTLGNLWMAGAIIGVVAEKSPQLLLPVGLAAFALGLLVLTGVTFALRAADIVYIPVTGFVLVGSHLLLVLWEAAGSQSRADSQAEREAQAPKGSSDVQMRSR